VQSTFLLVQFGCRTGFNAEFGYDLGSLLDARLQIGNTFRSERFDAVDLAFQAHTDRIELACGDAKLGEEYALEIVQLSTRLEGCKQAALYTSIQGCISI
jgi:hypothetical protein